MVSYCCFNGLCEEIWQLFTNGIVCVATSIKATLWRPLNMDLPFLTIASSHHQISGAWLSKRNFHMIFTGHIACGDILTHMTCRGHSVAWKCHHEMSLDITQSCLVCFICNHVRKIFCTVNVSHNYHYDIEIFEWIPMITSDYHWYHHPFCTQLYSLGMTSLPYPQMGVSPCSSVMYANCLF